MATTKTDAAGELNLSARQQAISAFMRTELKINEDGSITPDKKLVEKLIENKVVEGSNVTVESLKDHQAFFTDLAVGTTDGVGHVGNDFLKKHSKIDAVVMERLDVGRDQLRVGIQREAAVGIGEHASVKHGYLTVKYTSKSAGTSGAAMGRVRQFHANAGATFFGKK